MRRCGASERAAPPVSLLPERAGAASSPIQVSNVHLYLHPIPPPFTSSALYSASSSAFIMLRRSAATQGRAFDEAFRGTYSLHLLESIVILPPPHALPSTSPKTSVEDRSLFTVAFQMHLLFLACAAPGSRPCEKVVTLAGYWRRAERRFRAARPPGPWWRCCARARDAGAA